MPLRERVLVALRAPVALRASSDIESAEVLVSCAWREGDATVLGVLASRSRGIHAWNDTGGWASAEVDGVGATAFSVVVFALAAVVGRVEGERPGGGGREEDGEGGEAGEAAGCSRHDVNSIADAGVGACVWYPVWSLAV